MLGLKLIHVSIKGPHERKFCEILTENQTYSFLKYAYETVVCKMAAMSFRPGCFQYINYDNYRNINSCAYLHECQCVQQTVGIYAWHAAYLFITKPLTSYCTFYWVPTGHERENTESLINAVAPGQSGWCFADDIFNSILWKKCFGFRFRFHWSMMRYFDHESAFTCRSGDKL